MSITARMVTLDDIATGGGGSGDLTARAGTLDDWQTRTGAPARTWDDYATTEAPAPTERPTARFTFTPAAPVVGEEVTFDASTSSGVIDTYDWMDALSDEHAEGVTARFTFASAGNKPVVLTVTGPGGRHQAGQNVEVAESVTARRQARGDGLAALR